MKTRVKIVTYGDGSSTYFPQKKGWFLWSYFREYHMGDGSSQVSFKEYVEAEKYIIDYVRRMDGYVVASVTHVNIPVVRQMYRKDEAR
jgi:hypothetical protein